jgi:hypothetical protein
MKTRTIITATAAVLALAAPATASAADFAHASLASERTTVEIRVQERLAALYPSFGPVVGRCNPAGSTTRPVLRWTCRVGFYTAGSSLHRIADVTITRDGRTAHGVFRAGLVR